MEGRADSETHRKHSVSTCKLIIKIRLNIQSDFYFQIELTFAASRLMTKCSQ